jgi:hypothetical protein
MTTTATAAANITRNHQPRSEPSRIISAMGLFLLTQLRRAHNPTGMSRDGKSHLEYGQLSIRSMART